MSDLIKYQLEFPIHSSINLLYKRISTAEGLAEWFADDVHVKNDVYTFFWQRSEQKAKLLKKKENQFVRFRWLENDIETYFEFQILQDRLTGDVALLIIDFAEDEATKEEDTLLWNTQIEGLKHILGS